MSRCSRHPDGLAGWQCPSCSRALCVACAALTDHQVVVCGECGTLAKVILVARAEVFPFSGVWRAALRELWSIGAVVQVVTFATVAHSFFTVGKAMWVAGCLLTVAWVLNVARRSAIGIGAFGLPTWDDMRIVATGSLPRFTAAAGVIGLGAMAWTQLGLVAQPLGSPWPWVLAIAAVIVVPPALTIATVEGQGSTIVWPWRVGQWLRLLGADLRPLQVAVAIAVALELYESSLAPINRELEDTRMLEHLFAAWVPRVGSFAALGAVGALCGALVFTRAGELGHRLPEEDLVPRISAPPEGRYVPPRDLEEEERKRASRFTPIALEESAIDRGAKEEAMAAYRAGELLAAQLEPGPAVILAQWLAGAGDFVGAANLLRVVTAREGGDARAMVVLARLCAERLDAQAEALRLYEAIVRRFPDSAAAKFAAEQLTRP